MQLLSGDKMTAATFNKVTAVPLWYFFFSSSFQVFWRPSCLQVEARDCWKYSHSWCQLSHSYLFKCPQCLRFLSLAFRVLYRRPASMLTISAIYQHYPSAICCCDWHRFYSTPLFPLATIHTLCHVFRAWLISPYGFHMGTCCSC